MEQKTLKIDREEMYDLFQKGNYIRSFNTIEELNRYFIDDYDRRYLWGQNEPLKFCQHMNQMGYTVIKSNHLNFQEY